METWGPYHDAGRSGSLARYLVESRASELWVLSALVAAGVGVAALVVVAAASAGLRWSWQVPAGATLLLSVPWLEGQVRRWVDADDQDASRWPFWIPLAAFAVLIAPALDIRWPWWAPVAAGVATAGLGFAAAAVLLVVDHRRLIWAMAPKPEAEVLDLRPEPEPRFVYVSERGRPRLAAPDTQAALPSAEQRMAQARAARWQHFLRALDQGEDATWEHWQHYVFPDGSRLTRAEWQTICSMLVRAGLATRAHDRAPVVLCQPLPVVETALREVLLLPAPVAA